MYIVFGYILESVPTVVIHLNLIVIQAGIRNGLFVSSTTKVNMYVYINGCSAIWAIQLKLIVQ